MFVYFWWSSKFDLFGLFSRYFWPWMTLNDLETNFFEQFTWRASFWRITWLLSVMSEISSFFTKNESFLSFLALTGERLHAPARFFFYIIKNTYFTSINSGFDVQPASAGQHHYKNDVFWLFDDVISQNFEKFLVEVRKIF